MATSEIVINEYLGTELRQQYQRWQKEGAVRSENTEAFAEKSQRPDLIVCDNPMAPVAVETEFFPANTVEADALGRLGKIYLPTGGKIHTVIAVRLPTKYRQLTGGSIGEALANEQGLQYCLVSGESKPESHRWPASGYITGSATDIAYVIATAKVSPVAVAQGAELLEQGARRLAAMLSSAVASNPGLGTEIAAHLKQEPGPQTYAMAATILINAFVFQDAIAGTSPELSEIKSIYAFDSGSGKPTKMEVIAEWDRILAVNYWPIFGIAKKLISAVPPSIWDIFSESGLTTADRLLCLNLGKDPDLVGTIFQRLITDRRFLATFYTAPSSATLLSDLMIGEQISNGVDLLQVGSAKDLKLADFACGTGSLLCALYAELRTRLENAGVDSRSLHKRMVEDALVGCDVIPSATYITASQMSSVYPTIQYTTTRILTMPFGRLADGGVALGSLDLLEKQGAISVISTSADEVGAQADAEVHAWKAVGGVAVDDQSFDLIAMNPPFTRLTGGGGKSIDISRPLFAAFGTTPSDQNAMAKKAAKLFKGTVYHGNAGAASAFVEIGHRKLKSGGTIGLILPISALSGISWEACRDLWRKHYRGMITLTIASDEPGASAFSADTGVAECMFVGTRSDVPDDQVVSVSLTRKPASSLEGAEIGRRVRSLVSSKSIQSLVDGPFGGTPILIGEEKVGEALIAPLGAGSWPLSRIRDHAVAQVAYQLTDQGHVWLPGATKPHLVNVPLCRLSALGEPGPYHLDVSGSGESGGVARGPFELVRTSNPLSVTFPVLAAHDEKRERYLELAPDMEGLVRHATEPKSKDILTRRRDSIWATRTKLHFATDARFNANALIACLTTRDAIGGRAWPSFLLNERRYEKIVALWFNSSLGMLVYWWLSNKSQDGRGSVTTTRLGELVSFDPRTLSDEDLEEVDIFFEHFKSKHLFDMHECVLDANRAELDRFVARHLLKARDNEADLVDGLQLLRAKLAMEPSITGGRQQ